MQIYGEQDEEGVTMSESVSEAVWLRRADLHGETIGAKDLLGLAADELVWPCDALRLKLFSRRACVV